jgi:hypothetical protein
MTEMTTYRFVVALLFKAASAEATPAGGRGEGFILGEAPWRDLIRMFCLSQV